MHKQLLNNLYYRSFIPTNQLDNIQDEASLKLVISILNITITTALLKHFTDLKQKKEFLRLCQDNFADERILDFLIDSFPGSQQIISETIDRTILVIN